MPIRPAQGRIEPATGTGYQRAGGHSVGSSSDPSRWGGETREQLTQCAQRGQEGGPPGEAPVRSSEQEVRLQREVAAITASGQCSERISEFAIASSGDRYFTGTEHCIFHMNMGDERCEHRKSRGEGTDATLDEVGWVPNCPEPW